ncbi:MAG: ROK family protein [Bacteroidales bacterium]|nr:ROK family protein [Bacteroidales bacterium]
MENNINHILGIDIGGSGIKGSIVDIQSGKMLFERHRIPTPPNAKSEKIAEIIGEIAQFFDYQGVIGCGFPAVVQNGVIKTAANIGKSNIGTNANKLFSEILNTKVSVFNDADAAGYAAVNFGVGKGIKGTVLMLTIGTGIGSGLFIDGKLVPNTEFGHIYMQNGLIGEKYASDFVRKNEDLSWEKWGERFNEYLTYIEKLFNPDLIIIGGGTSKKIANFQHKINIKTKIVPAKLLNNAGIIGAACLAATK